MGADIYLPSLIDETYQTYGALFELAATASELARGTLSPCLREESRTLFEALQQEGATTGTVDPLIFDLVSQIRDLAEGETTVWQHELAQSFAQAMRAGPQASDPAVCEHVDQLVDLLMGQTSRPLHAALDELRTRLPQEGKTLPDTLAEAMQALQGVLEGDPAPAVRLLVTDQIVGTVQRYCTRVQEMETRIMDRLPLLAGWVPSLDPPVEPPPAQMAHIVSRVRSWLASLQETTGLLSLTQDLTDALHSQSLNGPPIHQALADMCAVLEQVQARSQEPLVQVHNALTPLVAAWASEVGEQEPRPQEEEGPAPLTQLLQTIFHRFLALGSLTEVLTRGDDVISQLLEGETECYLLPAIKHLLEELRQHDREAREEPPADSSQDRLGGARLLLADVLDLHYQRMRMVAEQIISGEERLAWEREVLLGRDLRSLFVQCVELLTGETSSRICEISARLHDALCLGQEAHEQNPCLALLEQLHELAHGRPFERIRVLAEQGQALVPQETALGACLRRILDLIEGPRRDQYLAMLLERLRVQADPLAAQVSGDRQVDLLYIQTLATFSCYLLVDSHDPLSTWMTWMQQQGHMLMEQGGEPLLQALPEQIRTLLLGTSFSADDQAMLREHLPQMSDALGQVQEKEMKTPGQKRAFALMVLFCWVVPLLLPPDAHEQEQDDDASARTPARHALLRLLEEITGVLHDNAFPALGCFHDPYTDASILWMSGWWWPTHIEPHLEEISREGLDAIAWAHPQMTGVLPVPQIRRLFQHLQATELVLPPRARLGRWKLTQGEMEEEQRSLEEWQWLLQERKERLLALLDEALRREEGLLCSL